MIVKCTQIHILLKAQKAGNATNLLSQNEQIGKCYDKEKVSTSLFQDSSTLQTKSRLKAYFNNYLLSELTPFRDCFRDTILLLTFTCAWQKILDEDQHELRLLDKVQWQSFRGLVLKRLCFKSRLLRESIF